MDATENLQLKINTKIEIKTLLIKTLSKHNWKGQQRELWGKNEKLLFLCKQWPTKWNYLYLYSFIRYHCQYWP